MLTKRNPFKMIGKVYKYEFKNTSKTLVPLYAILIILGIFIGIFGKKTKIDDLNYHFQIPDNQEILPFGNDDLKAYPENDFFSQPKDNTLQINYKKLSPAQYSFQFNSSKITFPHLIIGLLESLFLLFRVLIQIITIFILCRRFKTSLLEDEAYINLSLPVTISEHLWGRLLCYTTWILICFLATTFSSTISIIKKIDIKWLREEITFMKNFLNERNINIVILSIQTSIAALVTYITIILFSFCVTSITHLFHEHKNLYKIITILIILGITLRLFGFCFNQFNFQNIKTLTTSIRNYILANILLDTIFMTTTNIILNKYLNLD